MRIAAGSSSSVAASSGVEWSADKMFAGGETKNSTVTVDTSRVVNPAPQAVYLNKRWDAFSYQLTGLAPSEPYLLRLHFAESFYTAAGERVMTISANGTARITNFDPFAQAGAINIAIVKEISVTATAGGVITLTFASSPYNDPFINGIELIGPPLPIVVPPENPYLTGGSGGSFTDMQFQSYTGAGMTSQYHIFAAGRTSTDTTPLGLVLQFHGDGAYEFKNPNATYSLGGANGIRQVAIDYNMLCVPLLTPNSDGTWWTTGNKNADWVQSFIETQIFPRYNIDRSRIWLSGYSGGAQFISQYFVPECSALIVDGGAVISGGGGKPNGNTDPSTINPFAQYFKDNYFMHWYTYQGDTGWDDDGYNAYQDAQTGRQWYINNGFAKTSANYPAGGGHSSVTSNFGAELRTLMQAKYGA